MLKYLPRSLPEADIDPRNELPAWKQSPRPASNHDLLSEMHPWLFEIAGLENQSRSPLKDLVGDVNNLQIAVTWHES